MQFPLHASRVRCCSPSRLLRRHAGARRRQLLRGPHPFLKDNELSAHLLLAEGLGDSWSGTKLGIDYGYRLSGPLWLNLQLNIQKGTLHARRPASASAAAACSRRWPAPS